MYSSLKLIRLSLRFLIGPKMPYYAVARGRNTGIFLVWEDCSAQVQNFKKPIFKKFQALQEAQAFLALHGVDDGMKYRDGIPMKRKSPEPKQSDFWPDDISDDEDSLLIAAAEEVGDTGKKPKKRKSVMVSSTSKQAKHESIIWEPVGLKKFGKFEFPIDSEGYVIVYTDGSCENNGKATAVAGFGVYFSENHTLNTASPVSGRATNNCGEIQAAIYAIKLAKDIGIPKLCISTDSQFLINAVTMWLSSWKAKGWTIRSGEPVKNVVEFKELDELLKDKSIQIKWNYVKGHNGIIGNVKADRLARQGAAMYKNLKNM